MTLPKLGIIAGSGQLPVLLSKNCISEGRECFVLALEGAADETAFAAFPHATVRVGAVSEALNILRREHVRELVLAGGVKRPSLAALMPDAVAAKAIAKLGVTALFRGDDALLKGIISFLEKEGFAVVGADTLLATLLAPAGLIGGPEPDAAAREDIALGLRIARTLGSLDIGQAVIVENAYVLGVEAAEGTDALIARCAPLARERHRAVLVKARKPGQEKRADLPTIGPDTITRLHAACMRGLAVEAGGALLLERAEIKRLADKFGIFVIGIQ